MRLRPWGSRGAGLLLWVAAVGVAMGQAAGPVMGADEIVRRVMQHDAARREALIRYESERTYTMDYHGPIGERHARMQVRMNYSAPESKKFTVLSETGSTVFCHQIISRLMEGEREGALEANRLRSMLSPENYRAELDGEEMVAGGRAWVLEVSPRDDNKFSYKGRVWVNEADFAVMRIVGAPAKNPSWLMGNSTFDYTYAKDGEFWLPAKNHTVSHLRIGGEITLVVDYGQYEVVATGRPGGVISAANRGVGSAVAVSLSQ
jgi:hypothetical protein